MGTGQCQAPTWQVKALEGLLRSELLPPNSSTFAKAHLRRRCCSGASFWITRCWCPLGRPLSAKNPAGSGWSSQTRRTGSAWVSSLLPSPPLPTASFRGPLLLTSTAPVLTTPHFFSGMQRMRQVLERQSQVVEDTSPCHTQEPSAQPL